jgi:hypothetical protein
MGLKVFVFVLNASVNLKSIFTFYSNKTWLTCFRHVVLMTDRKMKKGKGGGGGLWLISFSNWGMHLCVSHILLTP